MGGGALRINRGLLAGALAVGLAGCAASAADATAEHARVDECSRPPPSARSAPARLPTGEELTLLRTRYGASAAAMALTIGAGSAIVEIERLRDEGASLERQLAAEARFDEALVAAELEVQTTQTALDCELHRIEHATQVHQDEDDDLNRALTVASIAVAAATAVAGSSLVPIEDTEVAQAAIGVTGGVTAGAIGVAQLLVEADTTLRHEQSALRDVWSQPERPTVLSPVVAAFLRMPVDDAKRPSSRRAGLLEEWERSGRLGDTPEERTKRAELFFGRGGCYSGDDLRARHQMVTDVKVVVGSMTPALGALAVQVRRRRAG